MSTQRIDQHGYYGKLWRSIPRAFIFALCTMMYFQTGPCANQVPVGTVELCSRIDTLTGVYEDSHARSRYGPHSNELILNVKAGCRYKLRLSSKGEKGYRPKLSLQQNGEDLGTWSPRPGYNSVYLNWVEEAGSEIILTVLPEYPDDQDKFEIVVREFEFFDFDLRNPELLGREGEKELDVQLARKSGSLQYTVYSWTLLSSAPRWAAITPSDDDVYLFAFSDNGTLLCPTSSRTLLGAFVAWGKRVRGERITYVVASKKKHVYGVLRSHEALRVPASKVNITLDASCHPKVRGEAAACFLPVHFSYTSHNNQLMQSLKSLTLTPGKGSECPELIIADGVELSVIRNRGYATQEDSRSSTGGKSLDLADVRIAAGRGEAIETREVHLPSQGYYTGEGYFLVISQNGNKSTLSSTYANAAIDLLSETCDKCFGIGTGGMGTCRSCNGTGKKKAWPW